MHQELDVLKELTTDVPMLVTAGTIIMSLFLGAVYAIQRAGDFFEKLKGGRREGNSDSLSLDTVGLAAVRAEMGLLEERMKKEINRRCVQLYNEHIARIDDEIGSIRGNSRRRSRSTGDDDQ